MKKNFVLALLHLVAWIRQYLSPWLYKKHYKVTGGQAAWQYARQLTMAEFDKEVNDDAKYGYKWDTFRGLLDSSFCSGEPQYFFAPLARGRDCDDYARIWRLWGETNGYTGYEYIVTEPASPFKRAHMVALLEKGGKWWLMNYHPYGAVNSREEALQLMTKWYSKDFIAVRYKHEKERC